MNRRQPTRAERLLEAARQDREAKLLCRECGASNENPRVQKVQLLKDDTAFCKVCGTSWWPGPLANSR